MKEVKVIGNIYNNIVKGISGGKNMIALQGSARSGKTRNIMIFLIQCCIMPEMVNKLMYENWTVRHAKWEEDYKKGIVDIKDEPKYESKNSYHISVVRGSLPVLKRSAFRDDFVEVMLSLGLWDQNRMNKTEMVYTFPNGSIMEFFATDGPEGAQKARGPHRDILFCNEANEIDEENFKQMRMRSYSFVLVDFNPSFSEEHWLFKLIHEERTFWFKTTFMDNPFLPTAARDEILSYKYTNPSLWQIFGMGEFAIVEGLVFPKDSWDVCDFTEIPIDCHKKVIGLDFGYTHDPTAAVLVFFKNIGSEQHIWVHELLYETGMKEKNIAYRLKAYNDIPKHAESANQLLLDNLEDNGMKLIYPTTKYALSVQDGVQKMLGYHIHVTKSSTDIMKEFRNYCWMKDRHDAWTAQPIDKWNHCFTGDTLIVMGDGSQKQIADITEGDSVMTSKGERKVIKRFDNGIKHVYTAKIQTNNGEIVVTATKDHKIKTTNGWTELQNVRKGDKIFLYKEIQRATIESVVLNINLQPRWPKHVYDLMVDDCHEYFANGMLVHNCIDAIRYCVMADKSARRSSIKKHSFSKRRLGM